MRTRTPPALGTKRTKWRVVNFPGPNPHGWFDVKCGDARLGPFTTREDAQEHADRYNREDGFR